MLKIIRIILIVFVALNLSIIALGQHTQNVRKNTPIRILKDKPTVYITFEGFGQREPRHIDDEKEAVWLRLHNNTGWSLVLNAYGADNSAFSRGTEKEVGLFFGIGEQRKSSYQVSAVNLDDSPKRGEKPLTDEEIKANLEALKYLHCQPPPGDFCTVCSVIKLPPGKSFLFSLPRKALCENLKAYISYQYDWEDDWGFGNKPKHRVYFSGSQLPKKTDKK